MAARTMPQTIRAAKLVLEKGLTAEAAARKAGVSVRTVWYQVAKIRAKIALDKPAKVA